MLNIGISFSFIKLRSPTSNFCSTFLSIINLINKIANKNRIINTRFSRRTWQNNACQSLLFTHAFLFLFVHCLDSQGSACEHSDLFKISWVFFFYVLDVTTMVLLGQPHKRSVHISTFFFCMISMLSWQFSRRRRRRTYQQHSVLKMPFFIPFFQIAKKCKKCSCVHVVRACVPF